MLTADGRPFSILNDQGFRDIVTPILKAFPPEERFTISPQTLNVEIEATARRIREEIKKEIHQVSIN